MLRRLEEVVRIGDRLLEFVRRLKVRTPSTVTEIAAAGACGVTLLAGKKNRNLPTSPFTHPLLNPSTPLFPSPTLSAGECKVSGGEPNGQSMDGPASQSTRSSLEAQMDLPLFLVAFSSRLLCRHGGATGFLLKVHGPCRFLGDECRI
jgi:hypothetical protein